MPFIYHIGFVAGGTGILIFFLGHIGKLYAPYLMGLLVLTSAAIVCLIRYHYRKGDIGHFYAPHIFILFFFISAVLPLVLLPPTARDELIVHLAVPKLYLERGTMFEIPFMGFSYVPMNIDLLYLIPMSLGSDTLPKLIHFIFALLTASAIYFYLLERLNKIYASLGFFLYLTTPIVLYLSATAYIDLGLTFYSTLALIAMLKWRDKFELKWLLFSAVATGLALGSKYSALILLLFFSLMTIYLYSRGAKNSLKAVQMGLLYLFTAIMIFAPWLIRNYLWTGNMFHPLANGFFATVDIASGKGYQLTSLPPLQMRSLLYGESLWYILLIPLRIFWEGKDGSHQFFDGVLNSLFLFFIPFAFVGIKNRDIQYMAVFTFFFFSIAFFTVDIVTRYLLPILPVLVIFTVYGVKKTFEIKRLQYVAGIVLVALFLLNGWYVVNLYKRYQPFAYFTGQDTREQYLSRMLPDYQTIAFVNSALPQKARVLLLLAGDRGYYLEREYYPDRGGSVLLKIVKDAKNIEQFKNSFTGIGITHLFIKDTLLNKFAADNFNEKEISLLSLFFQHRLVRLYSANDFSLYNIK